MTADEVLRLLLAADLIALAIAAAYLVELLDQLWQQYRPARRQHRRRRHWPVARGVVPPPDWPFTLTPSPERRASQ